MKKYITFFIISLFLLLGNVSALTEAPIDITSMSMQEISDALDKHIITSEQLVNIYLERISTYNDQFNAIRALNDNAINEAKELDKLRSEGKIKGVLHGIPVLVKTNIDVYGLPTTAGSKSLSDNYPNENAEFVQKLVDAGAIILGSTNMSEFAFVAGNSNSSYGQVKNVFNTDYTPFGSSGGSAVSVKAGFASAAFGTDTNLSVRVPASGAGVVGLRPTLGTVSSRGVIPYDTDRDTVGVLSQNVSDNMILYSVISDNRLDDVTDNLKGIKIGVIMQYAKGSSSGSGELALTDKDIYSLIENSIEALKRSGAEVIELKDFVKSSNQTIASTSASGLTMCDGFDEYIKGTTGTIRSFKDLVYSKGHIQSLSDYLPYCGQSNNKRDWRNSKKKEYRDYVDKVFGENGLDAVIYPTIKSKVPVLNKGGASSPGGGLPSVIGYPAITVPMGYIDEFSYGLEFLSLANSEDKLFNIAYNFEKYNENKIGVSTLTPSLYKVSNIVSELVKIYKSSNNDKVNKEVLQFFKDYNSIENKDEKANELIALYNKKDYKVLKLIVYSFIVIILYCVVMQMIIKVD